MHAFDTLVLAMIDAPVGSVLAIHPAMGPARVASVKTQADTWVDLDNLHRVNRSATDLVNRKAAFLEHLRLVTVDLSA